MVSVTTKLHDTTVLGYLKIMYICGPSLACTSSVYCTCVYYFSEYARML